MVWLHFASPSARTVRRAVPVLAALRVPLLPALASAQAQSVAIATVGSVAYAWTGQVSWPLAVLVGVPELVGVLIGWKIARSVPTTRLRFALLSALVLLAPYLALHPV
ncbi:MAG TPA: sulfite exporter TauE/SafE family protein [Actinopolymorphaceae bacterium]